ncbi:MAG: hypothetical protein ACKVU1_04410 [bacterium]
MSRAPKPIETIRVRDLVKRAKRNLAAFDRDLHFIATTPVSGRLGIPVGEYATSFRAYTEAFAAITGGLDTLALVIECRADGTVAPVEKR